MMHVDRYWSHRIARAVRAGDLTLAIAYTAEAVAGVKDESTTRKLVWACVITACPWNGADDLFDLAGALAHGGSNGKSRLRALDTVKRLANAISDLDTYVIAQMVNRIRGAAPNLGRPYLFSVLIRLVEGVEPDDRKNANVLFSNLHNLIPPRTK